MTKTTVTKVYLRYVRVQTMTCRVNGAYKFSRCWDVYLSAPDGERIVWHSSDAPEYDAARAIQARGIKGCIQVLRLAGDGAVLKCSTHDIQKAARLSPSGGSWKEPTSPPPLTVEVVDDDSDWPAIASAEDTAAFEAYCKSLDEARRAKIRSLKA